MLNERMSSKNVSSELWKSEGTTGVLLALGLCYSAYVELMIISHSPFRGSILIILVLSGKSAEQFIPTVLVFAEARLRLKQSHYL